MTVELICGKYEAEELGSAVKITADFVQHDDLKILGGEVTLVNEMGMSQEQVDSLIDKIPKKQLIDALRLNYCADEIVDIIFDPEVNWVRT